MLLFPFLRGVSLANQQGKSGRTIEAPESWLFFSYTLPLHLGLCLVQPCAHGIIIIFYMRILGLEAKGRRALRQFGMASYPAKIVRMQKAG